MGTYPFSSLPREEPLDVFLNLGPEVQPGGSVALPGEQLQCHQRNPVEDGKIAELVRRRPQPSKSPNFYLFSVGTRLIRQEILGFSW